MGAGGAAGAPTQAGPAQPGGTALLLPGTLSITGTAGRHRGGCCLHVGAGGAGVGMCLISSPLSCCRPTCLLHGASDTISHDAVSLHSAITTPPDCAALSRPRPVLCCAVLRLGPIHRVRRQPKLR